MLNISKSTVSRAFCNTHDIKEDSRRRVFELAEELNSVAQSLRKNETKRIGVIVLSFSIPFYVTALRGMQAAVEPEGYSLLICQSNEMYASELECIKLFGGTLFSYGARLYGICSTLERHTAPRETK